MFPGLNEFVLSIRGAWQLLMWDRNGLMNFDLSIDGFWRSFTAPLAAFPAFLLYALGGLITDKELAERALEAGQQVSEIPETGPFLFQLSLIYALGVILFPLLMVPISRQFGFANHYVPYIIAWNWVNALLTFLLAAPSLLLVAGLLSGIGAMAISFVIYLAALGGLYFTAQAALQSKPYVAIALVGIDMMLGLILRDLSGVFFS